MEVGANYTVSEAGVLPADWNVNRLGDGIELTSGHHVLAQHCNSDGDGVPYITGPADFPEGAIRHTKYTTSPGTICQAGDILITVKGSGTGTLVRADASYCISRQLMAIRPRQFASGYVYYSLLQSRSMLGAAATGLIPGLSRSDLLDKLLPFPPTLKEQEAITEALSDIDALIESMDQLLAKKRQIKQGAMQELITGKKRLLGFGVEVGYKLSEIGLIPGDWNVSTVGDEFAIELGKMLDTEKNQGVEKPFLGNRAVQWGYIDTSDIGSIRLTPTDLHRFRLRDGDLLVCEGGEIGRAAIWKGELTECYYQKALHRLRPKRGYSVRFMLNTLQFLAGSGFLMNFVTQTSIAHLPKEKFETVQIPVPPDVEQEAIAGVLTDMDGEIDALACKLKKVRQIKQGMMHNLLTGRARLV